MSLSLAIPQLLVTLATLSIVHPSHQQQAPVASASIPPNSCFAVYESRRVHCVLPAQVVHNVHLHDCIEHCQQWATCHAINYHANKRLCEVHSTAVITPLPQLNRGKRSHRYRRHTVTPKYVSEKKQSKTVYQSFSPAGDDPNEFDVLSRSVYHNEPSSSSPQLPTPIEQKTPKELLEGPVRSISIRANLQPDKVEDYYRVFQQLSPDEQQETWNTLLASNQLNAIDPDTLRSFATNSGFYLPDDYQSPDSKFKFKVAETLQTTTTTSSPTTTTSSPTTTTSSPTTTTSEQSTTKQPLLRLRFNSFTTPTPIKDEEDPWVTWLDAELKRKKMAERELTEKRKTTTTTSSPAVRRPQQPRRPRPAASAAHDILVMPASLNTGSSYAPPGIRPNTNPTTNTATYRPSTRLPPQQPHRTLIPAEASFPRPPQKLRKVSNKGADVPKQSNFRPAPAPLPSSTATVGFAANPSSAWVPGFTVEQQIDQEVVMPASFGTVPRVVYVPYELRTNQPTQPQAFERQAFVIPEMPLNNLLGCQLHFAEAANQQRVTRPAKPVPPPYWLPGAQPLALKSHQPMRSPKCSAGLIPASDWQYYVKQHGSNCPRQTLTPRHVIDHSGQTVHELYANMFTTELPYYPTAPPQTRTNAYPAPGNAPNNYPAPNIATNAYPAPATGGSNNVYPAPSTASNAYRGPDPASAAANAYPGPSVGSNAYPSPSPSPNVVYTIAPSAYTTAPVYHPAVNSNTYGNQSPSDASYSKTGSDYNKQPYASPSSATRPPIITTGGTYSVQPQPIMPWLISYNAGTPTNDINGQNKL